MMTGKRLRKIIQQPAIVPNVLHIKKMNIGPSYISKRSYTKS